MHYSHKGTCLTTVFEVPLCYVSLLINILKLPIISNTIFILIITFNRNAIIKKPSAAEGFFLMNFQCVADQRSQGHLPQPIFDVVLQRSQPPP